jgi:hypothetical protein
MLPTRILRDVQVGADDGAAGKLAAGGELDRGYGRASKEGFVVAGRR